MIFKSSVVKAQWDTWCYYHGGTYYLYYLITDQSPGEGFGVATSTDGVHWTDQGWALRASDDMVHFLGTGSVWKAVDFAESGCFICNYSEWRLDETGRRTQNILFARSEDLVHWTKYGDQHLFPVDTRFYERYGRWDCIFAIPRAEGGYWGTWTATPIGRDSLEGGIGLGFSRDGLHWEALPAPTIIPDTDESGAFHRLGDRNGDSYGAYHSDRRGEVHAMFGKWGAGMLAYRANGVQGPYLQAGPGSPLLQSPHTYFSRYFEAPDGVLVNHHSMDGRRAEADRVITYAAPFKRFTVDADGIQRWRWWSGNEALKGSQVDTAAPVDLQRGVVIETSLDLGDMGNGQLAMDVDGDTCKITFATDGRVSFSNPSAPEDWQRHLAVDCDIAFGRRVSLRVLVRRGMLELYADEWFVECWTMGCPDSRRLRLLPDRGGSVDEVHVWQMDL